MAILGNLGTMFVRDKHGKRVSVPVIRGDDGGYYTPEITDGILRWKASRPGMPEIPETDINSKERDKYVSGIRFDTDSDTGNVTMKVTFSDGDELAVAMPDWTKTDTTLSKSGMAADAAAAGKKFDELFSVEWMATTKKSESAVSIFPEQTVTAGVISRLQYSIQPGILYDVYINGVIYVCEAHSYAASGAYIGNPTLGGSSGEHNNEPFYIAWFGGTATSAMFYKDSTVTSPVVVKVTEHSYIEYNKLPSEFLPDGIVKSVNGAAPDADGNVVVDAGGGGTGTVKSVNNVSPDEAGNVALTAKDVGALTWKDLSGAKLAEEVEQAFGYTPANEYVVKQLEERAGWRPIRLEGVMLDNVVRIEHSSAEQIAELLIRSEITVTADDGSGRALLARFISENSAAGAIYTISEETGAITEEDVIVGFEDVNEGITGVITPTKLTDTVKNEIAEDAADIIDDTLSEIIGDPSGEVPAVPGYMALGMTGAAVGQVARIKAVDADGKPTEWEPVEMAGGGSGGASGGTWTILHEAELTEAAQIIISGFDTTLSEYLLTLIVPKVDAAITTGNSHFLGAMAFSYNEKFGSTGYASHYAYRGIMISGGRMILQKYDLNANGAGYDNNYRITGKSVDGAVVACDVAKGIAYIGTFPAGTKIRLEGR